MKLRQGQGAGGIEPTRLPNPASGTTRAAAAVPPAQWQSAIGRRPLTAAEQASRERYFNARARAAVAKARRTQARNSSRFHRAAG